MRFGVCVMPEDGLEDERQGKEIYRCDLRSALIYSTRLSHIESLCDPCHIRPELPSAPQGSEERTAIEIVMPAHSEMERMGLLIHERR